MYIADFLKGHWLQIFYHITIPNQFFPKVHANINFNCKIYHIHSMLSSGCAKTNNKSTHRSLISSATHYTKAENVCVYLFTRQIVSCGQKCAKSYMDVASYEVYARNGCCKLHYTDTAKTPYHITLYLLILKYSGNVLYILIPIDSIYMNAILLGAISLKR